MESSKLKRAIYDELVRHSLIGEWLHGPAIDTMFGLKDEGRARKQAILELNDEGKRIIASKSKPMGYKIGTKEEFEKYCNDTEMELKKKFVKIRKWKAHSHNDGELFTQDWSIRNVVEKELEESIH